MFHLKLGWDFWLLTGLGTVFGFVFGRIGGTRGQKGYEAEEGKKFQSEGV